MLCPPTDVVCHLNCQKVVADFYGGQLCSDGGAMLLREVDRQFELTRLLAGRISDPPGSEPDRTCDRESHTEAGLGHQPKCKETPQWESLLIGDRRWEHPPPRGDSDALESTRQ